MKNWDSDTMLAPLVKDEDLIYIGAPHTFSSRFIKLKVANDVSAILDAEYYSGSTNGWRKFKNFADETRLNGKSLAQDGFIQWDLPTDWVKNQVNSIPELPYDVNSGDGNGYYWMRLKSSANFKALTELDWLGMIWSQERLLKSRWQAVLSSKYLPTNQTHWYKEIELATKDVADDLKIQNLIDYEMQCKDYEELSQLATLKTLINILLPLRASDDLNEMRKDFEKLYTTKLSVKIKGIDTDKDEALNETEQQGGVSGRIMRY